MKRLERAYPEECQVDSASIARLYEELSQYHCHSVMITRYQKVIAEGWWKPYRPEYAHILYSVSKSFAGTAIGFAVQEGLLEVEDSVIAILGDQLPSKPCENMERLTVRHLLTMSTGQRNERHVFNQEESWVYSLLTTYLDDLPGNHFRYISSSTYLLSAIIQKKTGQTLYEYLKPRLFEPMGFSDQIWWEQSPEGMNTAFNGLNAVTEDITKLALLYLNHGRWEGKQLLSEEWVAEASKVQIGNMDNDKNQELGYRQGFGYFSEDYRSGYGYLFWHCSKENAYRGDGIFGQMCIVMPKQQMTVAITAGCPAPERILETLWKYLLPAVDNRNPSEYEMPSVLSGQHQLKQVLDQLSIPLVEGETTPSFIKQRPYRTYQMAHNELGILKLVFDFTNSRYAGRTNPIIQIITDRGELEVEAGHDAWIETQSEYDLDGFSCDHVCFFRQAACSGAWDGDEFVFRLVFTRTPFVDTVKVRFSDNSVIVQYQHTVKYGKDAHQLVGISEE